MAERPADSADVIVDRDVLAETRDGVRLSADVFHGLRWAVSIASEEVRRQGLEVDPNHPAEW